MEKAKLLLQNTASRAEYVYDYITDAIQKGDYPQGYALRETALANQLNVSRTPVREALRRLENEGIVKFTLHKGVIVTPLSLQEVHELYTTREILESAATGLAAQHIHPSEIQLLETLIAQEKQYFAQQQYQKMAMLNKKFHHTLYHAAHNRYLLQTLDNLRSHLNLLAGTTYAAENRAAQALQQHQEIVECILAKDSMRAETIAREHIRDARQIRIAMMVAEGLEE